VPRKPARRRLERAWSVLRPLSLGELCRQLPPVWSIWSNSRRNCSARRARSSFSNARPPPLRPSPIPLPSISGGQGPRPRRAGRRALPVRRSGRGCMFIDVAPITGVPTTTRPTRRNDENRPKAEIRGRQYRRLNCHGWHLTSRPAAEEITRGLNGPRRRRGLASSQ